MALIPINRNPSRKQLAVFGVTWLLFFGVAGWLALARGGSLPGACVLWSLAAVVPAIGWLVPAFLRAVYVAMAYAAWPIGAAVSVLLLAAVYYLVLTPTGLLMRLLGRDPMERKFPSDQQSHWQPRAPVEDVRRYFRQF